MSTCWKCSKQLGEGQTECEYGCGQSDERVKRAEALAAFLKNLGNCHGLDWSKVESLEDLVLIFSVIFAHVVIIPETDDARKLAKFLKPREEK